MGTDYVIDIEFQFCLKANHGQWQVIYDLSRTDVPSDQELKTIWEAFPKAFPLVLLPEFWSEKFIRVSQ